MAYGSSDDFQAQEERIRALKDEIKALQRTNEIYSDLIEHQKAEIARLKAAAR